MMPSARSDDQPSKRVAQRFSQAEGVKLGVYLHFTRRELRIKVDDQRQGASIHAEERAAIATVPDTLGLDGDGDAHLLFDGAREWIIGEDAWMLGTPITPQSYPGEWVGSDPWRALILKAIGTQLQRTRQTTGSAAPDPTHVQVWISVSANSPVGRQPQMRDQLTERLRGWHEWQQGSQNLRAYLNIHLVVDLHALAVQAHHQIEQASGAEMAGKPYALLLAEPEANATLTLSESRLQDTGEEILRGGRHLQEMLRRTAREYGLGSEPGRSAQAWADGTLTLGDEARRDLLHKARPFFLFWARRWQRLDAYEAILLGGSEAALFAALLQERGVQKPLQLIEHPRWAVCEGMYWMDQVERSL